MVRALGELWRPLSCGQREPLGSCLDVYYREAGHILGSASVELVSPQSRVICSGDLGRPSSPLLRDYHTSCGDARAVDLVLMEATYGDTEHRQSHGDVEAQLEQVIRRCRPAWPRTHPRVRHRPHADAALSPERPRRVGPRAPPLPVAIDSPMGLSITETYSDFARLFDRQALDQIARGDDSLDFRNLFVSGATLTASASPRSLTPS